MTSNGALLVGEAKKWVGVHEEGKNNCGKQVEIFQKAVDGKASGEAWCMAFMQFCVKQVEKEHNLNSTIFHSEHCLTTWEKSPAAIKFHTPEVGYIIIWQHGNTSAGHTGVVTGIDGKTLSTIEGNTNSAGSREGDGVYNKIRHIPADGELKIVGYIKPF